MSDRLRSLQSNDLSGDRRRSILESGEDSATAADIDRIERSRRINQTGTAESRITAKERSALGAWNNASSTLGGDDIAGVTDENTIGTGIGQSHRLKLSESQASANANFNANARPSQRQQQSRPVHRRPRRRSASPPLMNNIRVGSIQINNGDLTEARRMRDAFTRAGTGKGRPPSHQAPLIRTAQVNARQRAVRTPIESSLTAMRSNAQSTPPRRPPEQSQIRQSNVTARPENKFRESLLVGEAYMVVHHARHPTPGLLTSTKPSVVSPAPTAPSTLSPCATAMEIDSAQPSPTQSSSPALDAPTESTQTPPSYAVPPVVQATETMEIENDLRHYVAFDGEGRCRCRISDCRKIFKAGSFWRRHINKSHATWLEKLRATDQRPSPSNTASLSLAERVARQRDSIIGEHISRSRFHAREQIESLYRTTTSNDSSDAVPRRTALPLGRSQDPGEAARAQYIGAIAAISPSAGGFVQPSAPTNRRNRAADNRKVSSGPSIPAFLQATGSSDHGAAARRQYGGA